MTKNIITFDINEDIKKIAKTMIEKDIGIVAISVDKKIKTVLTDRDIVRIIANDSKITIKEIISIDKNKTLKEAIELMGKHKIKRLLVKDKEYIGIISLSDLINNLDNNILVDNLKKIFAIQRNDDKYETKVNDFPL